MKTCGDYAEILVDNGGIEDMRDAFGEVEDCIDIPIDFSIDDFITDTVHMCDGFDSSTTTLQSVALTTMASMKTSCTTSVHGTGATKSVP